MANRLLSTLLAAVLLLLVACGSSDDGDEPVAAAPTSGSSQAAELTDLERDYLVRVSGAWSLFTTKAASFRTVFSQAWPTNQRLFDALREAGAGTAWVESLEAVQGLEPPRRFQEDHSLLTARLEELVRIDAQIGSALETGELSDFVLLNAQLGIVGNLSNIEVDPLICDAIALPGEEDLSCRSAEALPGGDYGADVEILMLELDGKIGPRIGVWSPVWRPLATDAEFFAVLEIVQVEVDAAIQEALVRLASLIPPPGLSTDHELLVTYLEDLLEITTRAGSAIDARDVQAYETEAMKAPANTCATKSALSADMLLIAHGHFAAAEFCP